MHERGFKVRSDLKDRKYFHISFPQTGFPYPVKCHDILLGCGVWGQGSVSLDKSEKPLLHRTMPINQESTCLLTSQGSVWGRSRISLPSAIKCEGPSGQTPHCPRAQLLTLILYWAPLCGPVVKKSSWQYRRCWFEPWAGKIPWRRKWQPIPVFLPGKSQGQSSLVGYGP